jgi:glycosyltransferase involved in cell wall biosynthesis
MNIEVSIIIPVYNKANYLGACLDSVLGQTFRPLEVICVDDASEDQCAEILQDYANRDDRLKIISNTSNLGPGLARNKGIEAAKGRFLRFVDADDLLPLKSTEALYSRAIKDNVEVVKGSLALFRDTDHLNYEAVYSVPDTTRTQLSEEEILWIPWWHTSYLVSSELIHRHQLRYPNLIRGEDPAFLAAVLVNAGRLSMLEQIVYLYRSYPKSCGSGGVTINHVLDHLKHAEMTKRLFYDYFPDCWRRGYGPFLLEKMRGLIERCDLDPAQLDAVDGELAKIWNSDDPRKLN